MLPAYRLKIMSELMISAEIQKGDRVKTICFHIQLYDIMYIKSINNLVIRMRQIISYLCIIKPIYDVLILDNKLVSKMFIADKFNAKIVF